MHLDFIAAIVSAVNFMEHDTLHQRRKDGAQRNYNFGDQSLVHQNPRLLPLLLSASLSLQALEQQADEQVNPVRLLRVGLELSKDIGVQLQEWNLAQIGTECIELILPPVLVHCQQL